MQINKKIIKIIGIISIILFIATTGMVTAGQINIKNSSSLASVVEQCEDSLDSEGFGHAKMGSVHIQNETVQFTVPCIIEVDEGSSLQLTKVRVESNNLFIATKLDAKKPSHLTINNSTFKSMSGGFQIQVKSPVSSVTIKNSTFDYPLSIGVAVGRGDDDNKADLQITDSSFLSSSKNSEGVVIATTGKASFTNNKFKLGNPDESPLLVAAQCQQKNNGTAIVHCQ